MVDFDGYKDIGDLGMAMDWKEKEIDELEKEYPKLVEEIRQFDPFRSISIVAGLLTFPGYHRNTIRLEFLQHLIHRNAVGKHTPTRNRISKWINSDIGRGWLSHMEDPVEDVFVSNIVSGVGNTRIFEGIWEANDFWLQHALNALRSFQKERWAQKVLGECFALLVLSEEVARRCNLERNCMGGGSDKVELPIQSVILNRSVMTCFSVEEILNLGIPVDVLECFVHDYVPAAGGIGNSSLERRPLIRYQGGIIVSIPAAISPAIRMHILDQVMRVGADDKFKNVIFGRQIRSLFSEGIKPLGGEFANSEFLPPLPKGLPVILQEIIEFDVGKYAHVLFCDDSFSEILKTGITGQHRLSVEDEKKLRNHCVECAKMIVGRSDYLGGFTIVVHGGLGRGFAFAMDGLPSGWQVTGCHLHDFVFLGRAKRLSLLEIWKLAKDRELIAENGVDMMNMNGELNLMGYYWQHDERLVPRNMPSSNCMLVVGNDFVAGVRHDLRVRYDSHAVERNPGIWAVVSRYNVDSFFKKVSLDPIYIEDGDLRYGRLRGVVETPLRGWWVSHMDRLKVDWQIDMQFKIWEALLYWMGEIASVADNAFPALPNGPIEIFLDLKEIGKWKSCKLEDLPEAQELEVRVNRHHSSIYIGMPLGFLQHFANSENIAERKLVYACFEGAGLLSNCQVDEDVLSGHVQSVVKNDEARFFHLAYAQTIRQHLKLSDKKKLLFTNDGDVNFECLGLSCKILGKDDAEFVLGMRESGDFLNKVVDDSWSRIREILCLLDRRSVIVRAFQNIEAVEQDKQQWVMTASALLATHEDRDDVVISAHERENARAGAELSSRIIVEMAVCACPEMGGRAVSDFDFRRLLALMRLLLYAANSSDAIRCHMTLPKVELFRNGEFYVDDSYMEKILRPYMVEYFSVGFEAAAAGYGDYYQDPRVKDEEGDGRREFPADFLHAFQSEYGVSPDDFLGAYTVVEEAAIKGGLPIVETTLSDFRDLLVSKGISDKVVECYIKHFCLKPRDQWDEDHPKGFKARDWYPWRYRRRLSVVARPFICNAEGDNPIMIYSPGLVRDSIGLLFDRLLNGRLPADDFSSQPMRSWIGEVTRLRGDEFEHTVASELRAAGLQALVGRPMTEFGADSSYGDIDVIAWLPESRVVYLIECKRLRFARTAAEVGEQLREFKGVEMDRLARHVRRCQWLEGNQRKICQALRIGGSGLKLEMLLVTSTVVPMQFTEGLPLSPDRIIPVSRLKRCVKNDGS